MEQKGLNLLQVPNLKRECRSESDYEAVVLDLAALSGIIGIALLCLLLSTVMFKLCCWHKSNINGNYVEVGQDIPSIYITTKCIQMMFCR